MGEQSIGGGANEQNFANNSEEDILNETEDLGGGRTERA